MAVAIIADAHLGGPGGPAQGLVDQIDGLGPEDCEGLILLGDIFHVWVALPSFETEEIRLFLAAVERLRRRGVPVQYVEGNRDFFLRDGPYADRFDEVVLETSFEAGGKRYLAVHGDGLNDRDLSYRFWRWLSKSPPVRLLVRSLPAAVARRFVRRTEERLARTNFKHKSRIPEEAISKYARRRLAEGYDVLLLGHFHEPRTLPLGKGTRQEPALEGRASQGKRAQQETSKGGGRVAGEARLLDAWFRSRRVEWFGP